MFLTRALILAGLLLSWSGLLVAPAARAQAPGWQAAIAVATTTTSSSNILFTATDASGNVVVAGEFTGAITLGNTTLSSPTIQVPFVAKWNTATSTWAWATQLSSNEIAFVGGLAVVGSSVYLSGSFKGTASAGAISLSSPASYNAYVAKLTDAGTTATWVWVQQAGGSSDDFGNGLAVQGTSLYTVGLAQSPTLTFGTLTPFTLNTGSTFITKLTDNGPSGSYTWALVHSGQDFAWLRTVAVRGTSIYAAGEMQGTQTFGTTTLTTSNPNDADVLLTKLTDAGTTASWTWAQRAGGPGYDQAIALATTGTGIYVTGNFDGATALFGTTTLTSAGGNDIFAAKLIDAGPAATWAWAQRAGGTAYDASRDILVRGASVYLSGEVVSSPAVFGSTSLVHTGNATAFVARLADAGTSASFAWAQLVGSPYSSTASTLASSGSQVYLGGSTSAVTTFGNQTTIGSSIGQYGFLATITDAAALPTLAPVALVNSLSVFPNPTHRIATVQLPAGLAAGLVTLTLLDALGRVACTRTAPVAADATTASLEVAGLAPGVYTLRVAEGERTGTARLVVE